MYVKVKEENIIHYNTNNQRLEAELTVELLYCIPMVVQMYLH